LERWVPYYPGAKASTVSPVTVRERSATEGGSPKVDKVVASPKEEKKPKQSLMKRASMIFRRK